MATETRWARVSAGVAEGADAVQAAERAAAGAAQGLGGDHADLVLLFVSAQHVSAMGTIGAIVRRELHPGCLVGVSAAGVIGGRWELEDRPGVSLLAMRLPEVSLVPFVADDLGPLADDGESESRSGEASEIRVGGIIGVRKDLRATLVFMDPFSVPVLGVLRAFNRAVARTDGTTSAEECPPPAIVGGLASGGRSAGGNALMLDERVHRGGLVGVSLRGAIRVDTAVSPACRPVGPHVVITRARRNLILELGGRPALQVVRQVLEGMPQGQRDRVRQGLFIGRVADEHRERFGRGDYLIRQVVGVEEASEAIAVSDFVRVGQTVRFHVRDAATAEADLALLMDAQRLHDPPLGALLIACTGRGRRLYQFPNRDVRTVGRVFERPLAGEELARGGVELAGGGTVPPLAGFFAAGEIAPVRGVSYLHGQTACVTLFRTPA